MTLEYIIIILIRMKVKIYDWIMWNLNKNIDFKYIYFYLYKIKKKDNLKNLSLIFHMIIKILWSKIEDDNKKNISWYYLKWSLIRVYFLKTEKECIDNIMNYISAVPER